MSNVEKTTLRTILNAAKAEFLEKGFRSATLRKIVKTACVTTGTFYGYYSSKEDLFDALAGKQYERSSLKNCLQKTSIKTWKKCPDRFRKILLQKQNITLLWRNQAPHQYLKQIGMKFLLRLVLKLWLNIRHLGMVRLFGWIV